MADRSQRERLLTFLLLPAVVVSVLVLLGVTLRNSLELEKLRERSIVEATYVLASDNASRLEKAIIDQDNAVREAVNAKRREHFGDSWLEVADKQTPTVRAVLLVDLTSPNNDIVAIASRGQLAEDERFRQLLVHEMLRDMELNTDPISQLRHLHDTYRGQAYLLSYWQERHRGRRYLIVAWHYVPLIVHDLFTSLYSDREDQSRLNVVDAEGRIIYGPPLSRGGVTIGRPFETTLYKWRLNATILAAEELGTAVARRRVLELVMVALSIAVVIAGLIIVFVAAARERHLSNLKSDFVANVSHELKTPLSVVRMFGELLHRGQVESPEKQQQYLQIINTESERLTGLIENLLDFARAERGRASYNFSEGSLTSVVQRAVEACLPRTDRTEIVLELPDDLPTAWIDERAVEVALINLIDNALKYAPEGRRVIVAVRERGRLVEFRVSDEGPGISAEERRRVFERFFRGRSAEATKSRGSGIGLSLVQHIATAHRGRAWVEASAGGGSTFVFSIRAK